MSEQDASACEREAYRPMTDRERAYALILRRPPEAIRGPCALYVYTALKHPRFALVHTADTIGALLDWMRGWLRADIADELAHDEDFWRHVDADVLAMADPDLRAFVHYALNKPIAPVYAYDRCIYMEGLLDDRPDYRFVIAWEARAPRQDVAYAIVQPGPTHRG